MTGLGAGARRRARNIVFATGYYDHPNRLGVPGEDRPHVSHYYDEPHPFYRKRVVVVGGKNSAAIAALELYRAGATVTLVHRRDAPVDRIKYWIRPDIKNRIKQGSIAARFESRVVEITQSTWRSRAPRAGRRSARTPSSSSPGTTRTRSCSGTSGCASTASCSKPDHDPETLETNVPGVFLAGSIVSGRNTNLTFIETGRFHGAAIVKAILAKG